MALRSSLFAPVWLESRGGGTDAPAAAHGELHLDPRLSDVGDAGECE